MKYYLRKQVHSSWLVAIICVAIFVGVVLAPTANISWLSSIAWLLTGTTLCLLGLSKRYVGMIPTLVFGGLLVGLWRGSAVQVDLAVYKNLRGSVITLQGTVSDDADTDKSGNAVLRLKNIVYESSVLPGNLWISVAGKTLAERSDRVTIEGTLEEGFGTFSGSMYRANIKTIDRPVPGDVALHVRNWFSEKIRKAIPEPESALGIGFLVGQRRNLPDELNAALKIAGLTHIVVASGYNLTILVRLTRRLFSKLSKYLSVLAGVGLIVGFMAVTGASPSMSRAGLVTGLSLLAWYYGRKIHPLVLLPLAVAVTVLINPSYAWGDIGWQLSFAAFGGVMILAPLLQAFYFGDKKPGVVRQILGETISATLMTAPILIASFGYISTVAIPANLLILPLLPLAMLLTFISGIGAVISSTFAWLFGLPAYLLLAYMTATANFFANFSGAKLVLTVQPWHVAVMYLALCGFMVFMWWRTKLNLRDSNIVE